MRHKRNNGNTNLFICSPRDSRVAINQRWKPPRSMVPNEVDTMINGTAHARADGIVAVDVQIIRHSRPCSIHCRVPRFAGRGYDLYSRVNNLEMKPGAAVGAEFFATRMIDQAVGKNAAVITSVLQLRRCLVETTRKVNYRLSALSPNTRTR